MVLTAAVIAAVAALDRSVRTSCHVCSPSSDRLRDCESSGCVCQSKTLPCPPTLHPCARARSRRSGKTSEGAESCWGKNVCCGGGGHLRGRGKNGDDDDSDDDDDDDGDDDDDDDDDDY